MSELESDRTLHPGVTWRRVIEESGRLQRDVALDAGLSLKHLNTYLNGRTLLSVEAVVRLARVCDVDVKPMWHTQCDYILDLALGKRDATHDDGGTDLPAVR